MNYAHDRNLDKQIIDINNNSFFQAGIDKSPEWSFFNEPSYIVPDKIWIEAYKKDDNQLLDLQEVAPFNKITRTQGKNTYIFTSLK